MRIVIDTNVALSALLWRGTPYPVAAGPSPARRFAARQQPTLLEELSDVLRRPVAAKRLAIIGMTVQEVLANYVEAVEWVVPTDVPRVVLGDADDDHPSSTKIRLSDCLCAIHRFGMGTTSFWRRARAGRRFRTAPSVGG